MGYIFPQFSCFEKQGTQSLTEQERAASHFGLRHRKSTLFSKGQRKIGCSSLRLPYIEAILASPIMGLPSIILNAGN